MTAARGGVWFSESEALSPTQSQSSAAFRVWGLSGAEFLWKDLNFQGLISGNVAGWKCPFRKRKVHVVM